MFMPVFFHHSIRKYRIFHQEISLHSGFSTTPAESFTQTSVANEQQLEVSEDK
jgi:hypothetical protein